MNAMDYLRVAPLINDCPNCQNSLVGNGQGTLKIEDDLIERSCKCGFHFEYDVRKGTSKATIQKAIKKSLAEM